MKLDISEILVNPSVSRDYPVVPEFDELVLRHARYPVSRKSPFTLSVSMTEGNKLSVRGDTEVCLLFPCDRCLEEVAYTFDVHIDECIGIKNGEIEGDDAYEHSFMDGGILDVDKLVFNEIVVALPAKVLCKEDCKGLCSVCGANLNYGDCGCDRTVPDPRMAAIQDIFRSFNQDN